MQYRHKTWRFYNIPQYNIRTLQYVSIQYQQSNITHYAGATDNIIALNQDSCVTPNAAFGAIQYFRITHSVTIYNTEYYTALLMYITLQSFVYFNIIHYDWLHVIFYYITFTVYYSTLQCISL